MSRPLKIVHLVFSLGAGGMENGVINISHRLPRDRYALSICTLEAGGSLENRVDAQRVELLHVRRRHGNDLTLPFRLARELRRRRVDILHTHNWCTFLEGLLAAKLARVPILVHGEHGKIQDRRRQIFAQRWGWRAVHQVLAVSDDLADRMARAIGFPRERIQVIPNGVDTERFRPSEMPKAELRGQLGLLPDGFLVGMVARFVEFKDHAGVFRALASLRELGVEAHLALAGEGPLHGQLEEFARELGIADRVHFLGHVPQVGTLLHSLDVLVSNSSHCEGMSNVILEAMACGVPVVATRVAASPELLDEGTAGLLIPPRDPEALAQALRQVIESPTLRSHLRRAGRLRAQTRFSIAAMVGSYSQLYQRLVGRGG